jgi:hypothetical protein
VAKIRVEIEGADAGVFITRDGEVVQQSISTLGVSLSSDGRYLHIGQPVAGAFGGPQHEAVTTYEIGKATIILETLEG